MSARTLCEKITSRLPELFWCTPAPEGALRVRTPMYYPDGSIIDVFVVPTSKGWKVTDFAQASGWLRDQLPGMRLTEKQKRLIQDVCLTLGVERHRGELLRYCTNEKDLSECVCKVAEAALRVADLWFTTRTRAIESFADEVQDFLADLKLSFQRNVTYAGRSTRKWRIDYQTESDERFSWVCLLSTPSSGATNRLVEHVTACWYDLNHHKVANPRLQFISLFDDTHDVWQERHFKLVEGLSYVCFWSQQADQLKELLLHGGREE